MSSSDGARHRRAGVDVGDAVRVVGPRYVPRSTPVARSGDTAPLPLGRRRRASWGALMIAGPALAGVLAVGVGAASGVVGWTALEGSALWRPSAPAAAGSPVPVVGVPIVAAEPGTDGPAPGGRPVLVSDTPGAPGSPGSGTSGSGTTSSGAGTSGASGAGASGTSAAPSPAATPTSTRAPAKPTAGRPSAAARPVAPAPSSSAAPGSAASPASPSGSAGSAGSASAPTPLPTVPTGSPAPGAG